MTRSKLKPRRALKKSLKIQIKDRTYLLKPGSLLWPALQKIKVPNNHCAGLLLRSTAARAGFEHSFSGWCDPGFHGVLVLELRNNLQNHCLELKAGMRLVQLVVHKLDGKATAYELRGTTKTKRVW